MASLRIENAMLLTMADGARLIDPGVVTTVGGAIEYAGTADGAPLDAADRVIDASGCVLMPGLINAHTHAAMTLMRGYADDMDLGVWLEQKIWPLEVRLTDDDVYWGTMLACIEMLGGGVTCFNDMYHFYGAATRAAVDAGIRACPSAVLLGFLPNADQILDDAADFVRRTQQEGNPRIHPMIGPHAPYTCPDELLQAVVAKARELGVPVHIHLAETEQEVADSLLAHGERPIAHMESIGLFQAQVAAAHCVHLDEAELRILAQRGVGVAHCPGSNMKLASGFAPVSKLLAAGVTVGIGTDGAASNNNLDMFEEMLLAGIIEKGHTGDPKAVPAEAVLRMATVDAAAVLGLGGVTGSLQPGKRADMILVDMTRPHLQPLHNVASHLVYAARADDVRMTIVEGEVVYCDGEFTCLDAHEIIARANECARRLAGN